MPHSRADGAHISFGPDAVSVGLASALVFVPLDTSLFADISRIDEPNDSKLAGIYERDMFESLIGFGVPLVSVKTTLVHVLDKDNIM